MNKGYKPCICCLFCLFWYENMTPFCYSVLLGNENLVFDICALKILALMKKAPE